MAKASGFSILRPKARIIRTLGEELISSELVAVIELVKNSYDADASNVIVRLTYEDDASAGSIEIIDDGKGMALETLQGTWLEPATSHKKKSPWSDKGRRVLGEKGIGRFAASKIADKLEVITRQAGDAKENLVRIDWAQFEDNQTFLDEVRIEWRQREPREVSPNGLLAGLIGELDVDARVETDHGTILRMSALRSDWTKSRLMELKVALSRLVSPFKFDCGDGTVPEFQIFLVVPEHLELSGRIVPPDTLDNPDYSLKGRIDESGNYEFRLNLRGSSEETVETGRFKFDGGRDPASGPFDLEVRVWDRDTVGKEISRNTLKAVLTDLDEVSGLNIYRDGFRVLPYGEKHSDWLRLDKRRVNNPTLRLSNNQILGYISISADQNPGLRDQSNREGLVEGPELDDLRELVRMSLSVIEIRRHAFRRTLLNTDESKRKKREKQGGLFADFNLSDVKVHLRENHPGDKALLEIVDRKERELEIKVSEVQEVLSRYRRLATLGQLIDMVLHEGRTSIAKIKDDTSIGIRSARNHERTQGGSLDKVISHFISIAEQVKVLADLFNRIAPFGGRVRGRPKRVVLEQAIASAFSVMGAALEEAGIEVDLPKTETQATIDGTELQEIFVNLLTNAVYWLNDVERDKRKISVVLARTDPSEVEIIFADSGPGVPPEIRDQIFDPYFSTRPNGIGLGLAIAGEIVSENYGGSLELVESSVLPGANFRITLKRRI